MPKIDDLDENNKYLIKMYQTARQFNYAIPHITLPNINGIYNNIFPYIVNKSFACEVYLKLLLKINNKHFKKIHNIKELYLNSSIDSEFRESLKSHKIDTTTLEKDIEMLSNSFETWRYIYENKEVVISNNILEHLSIFLDGKCKKVILEEFQIDMDKNVFI